MTTPQSSSRSEGPRDFDFLHSRWRVHNRRLVRPLTGSDEWDEFDGRSLVCPVWNGEGLIEEWEADTPSSRVSAISVHLYDAAAAQWRLQWATRAAGRFGMPTVGRFSDGRGEFFDREEFERRAILLRLVWEPRKRRRLPVRAGLLGGHRILPECHRAAVDGRHALRADGDA
jgi:hypothetical protein